MVKYCRRRGGGGGPTPQKIPKLLFLGNFFRFYGGADLQSPPPSGSAHDLYPFYGKVNFGNRGFYMGKSENYGFLKMIAT